MAGAGAVFLYFVPPAVLGRAVQINPIKPILKAPKTRRLKLKHDETLSIVAFEFNLRRHT
jgi:hypothetical protein